MRSNTFLWLYIVAVSLQHCVYVTSIPHHRSGDTRDERCAAGQPVPPTVVNTTARLHDLRALFPGVPGGEIHAYIVPTSDAHQSSFVSEYDERRAFISGFKGSAGTAVITTNKAALWTDGRYFLEAEDTLDCNWILMKQGETGVPTITEWLLEELEPHNKVGANPFFISASTWSDYDNRFSGSGIYMEKVVEDLIDKIWTSGRPNQPNTTINELPVQYAGMRWQDKVQDVRVKLTENKAAAYVVTGLDETAWLFNLRAKDILFNPFFISYAIVEENKTSLFIVDHLTKLTKSPTDEASNQTLNVHLNTGTDGQCGGQSHMCVEVLEYNSSVVTDTITRIANENGDKKVWIPLSCSQAIYEAVPQEQRLHAKSAIALTKSLKNPIEREGMFNAQLRDSVALIKFLEKLEREVKEGVVWTEVSASYDLMEHRRAADLNRGLSFPAIAGSGSNGAIIHYTPSNITDKRITTSEMFLLDSGGQYLDGTTDVTRTFHFGNPSEYQKECYTRVLMGQIDLAKLKWPKGLYGHQIDATARAPLWETGLIYRHGTGHGIGAYLSVHEGPGRIYETGTLSSTVDPISEHMFFSDEPGYYEDGEFGIRLENIVMVEKVTLEHQFPNVDFLGFKTATLVPYETNLIKMDMLNQKQIEWLDAYNKRIEEEVLPRLNPEAKQWVQARTRPVTTTSGSNAGHPTVLTLVLVLILMFIM